MSAAPCTKCPWIQPGRPDITPELETLARDGEFFCCHVDCGLCRGAAAEHKRALRRDGVKY